MTSKIILKTMARTIKAEKNTAVLFLLKKSSRADGSVDVFVVVWWSTCVHTLQSTHNIRNNNKEQATVKVAYDAQSSFTEKTQIEKKIPKVIIPNISMVTLGDSSRLRPTMV